MRAPFQAVPSPGLRLAQPTRHRPNHPARYRRPRVFGCRHITSSDQWGLRNLGNEYPSVKSLSLPHNRLNRLWRAAPSVLFTNPHRHPQTHSECDLCRAAPHADGSLLSSHEFWVRNRNSSSRNPPGKGIDSTSASPKRCSFENEPTEKRHSRVASERDNILQTSAAREMPSFSKVCKAMVTLVTQSI